MRRIVFTDPTLLYWMAPDGMYAMRSLKGWRYWLARLLGRKTTVISKL